MYSCGFVGLGMDITHRDRAFTAQALQIWHFAGEDLALTTDFLILAQLSVGISLQKCRMSYYLLAHILMYKTDVRCHNDALLERILWTYNLLIATSKLECR